MPQEPLSNDEVIARLDGILKKLEDLKSAIKELQLDATE